MSPDSTFLAMIFLPKRKCCCVQTCLDHGLGGFPDRSVVKNLPASAGDMNSIPGSGRTPGEGNGHPLQSSCLENLMDREACQATVHGAAKVSDMT